MKAVLGLDIGGANLKAAHDNGVARTQPFALWKNPNGLAQALQELLHTMLDADTLAVTMTGELCDCFETKRQGVHHILAAVEAVAGRREIRVWGNDGILLSMSEARALPLRVAAANWLALATFAGRYAAEGSGMIIDIGSTTTDLVPLWQGRPVPRGRTDPQRLYFGELVYVGVRRTPLCALSGVEFATELFATTLDVMLLTDNAAEDELDHATADGRSATKAAALARLARMWCADLEIAPAGFERDLRRFAMRWLKRLTIHLANAAKKVAQRLVERPRTIVLAGSGEFLARMVLTEHRLFKDAAVVSLSERLGAEVSQAACAYAVATLAKERLDGL